MLHGHQVNRIIFPFLALMVLTGCGTFAATSGRIVVKDDTTVVDFRIVEKDRAMMEQYYSLPKHRKKGLPPGLAKREGNLPPGLAKREKLPPGLQGEALPYELEEKLSPLPSSMVRIRIGHDIVLMNRTTRVIFDIVYDIAR